MFDYREPKYQADRSRFREDAKQRSRARSISILGWITGIAVTVVTLIFAFGTSR